VLTADGSAAVDSSLCAFDLDSLVCCQTQASSSPDTCDQWLFVQSQRNQEWIEQVNKLECPCTATNAAQDKRLEESRFSLFVTAIQGQGSATARELETMDSSASAW
jgi:hypothetical protein